MMTEERPATRLSLADLAQHVREETPAPKKAPPAPQPSTQQSDAGQAGFRRGAAAERPVSRPVKPASPESVKYLRDLVVKKAPWTTEEYVKQVIAQGQSAVSKGIVRLKKMPDAPADPNASGPVKGAAKPARPHQRTNKYPGTCENCGTRVAAEEGTVALADNGKWEVEHLPGECAVSDFPFPVGRYAVVLDGETHFFRTTVESGLMEQAGDTLYPVKGARVQQVVDLIAADPEAASRLYGQEIGVCGRCGRSLTDESSRAAGIGPVCAGKGWY